MSDFENAFALVSELSSDFHAHRAEYLSAAYSEAQVRQDFIDKFFAALGWDVTHQFQKNPYKQEVRVERNVKAGKSKRRADYAFFIAPKFDDPRLFAEAKKPHGELATKDNYFQTSGTSRHGAGSLLAGHPTRVWALVPALRTRRRCPLPGWGDGVPPGAWARSTGL